MEYSIPKSLRAFRVIITSCMASRFLLFVALRTRTVFLLLAVKITVEIELQSITSTYLSNPLSSFDRLHEFSQSRLIQWLNLDVGT